MNSVAPAQLVRTPVSTCNIASAWIGEPPKLSADYKITSGVTGCWRPAIVQMNGLPPAHARLIGSLVDDDL
jgi:hypothetical protein